MYDITNHHIKEGYPYINNINDYMWRQWVHMLYRISRGDKSIPKDVLIKIIRKTQWDYIA